MKKIILVLLVLSFASASIAGLGYYGGLADTYDQYSGTYYATVFDKEDGGFLKSSDIKIIDIYIFDPAKNEGIYLFAQKNNHRITAFVYESAYDVKSNSLIFNSDSTYLVKNNQIVNKRAPKDKILVSTYDEPRDTTTLWIASKSGKDLNKIKVFGKNTDWHLDVKNGKIRFVTKENKQIVIESAEW